MLSQRLRRWHNINTLLGQRIVFDLATRQDIFTHRCSDIQPLYQHRNNSGSTAVFAVTAILGCHVL